MSRHLRAVGRSPCQVRVEAWTRDDQRSVILKVIGATMTELRIVGASGAEVYKALEFAGDPTWDSARMETQLDDSTTILRLTTSEAGAVDQLRKLFIAPLEHDSSYEYTVQEHQE